jgi:hypothetical protein
VADEVSDLFGARGVVDRDRCRSGGHHGDVRHVELQPVAEHQDDPVPGCDAERGETAREPRHPGRVLRPGDLLAVQLANRDAVRDTSDRADERVEHVVGGFSHAGTVRRTMLM